MLINVPQILGLYIRKLRTKGRDLFGGTLQRLHIPRCSISVDNLCHQTVQIENTAQSINQLLPQHAFPHKLIHGVEPIVDDGGIFQRLFDKAFDHSLTHRRFGPIKDPQQRTALLTGPHGLGQFQIAAGDQVQIHVLAFLVKGNGQKPLQTGFLGFGKILQHGRNRILTVGFIIQRQFRQIADTKVLQQDLFRIQIAQIHLIQQIGRAVEFIFDKIAYRTMIQKVYIENDLGRRKTGQLIDQLFPIVFLFQLARLDLTGGNIGKTDAKTVFFAKNAGNIVVASFIEHTGFYNCAGRNDTDNIPLDKSFSQSRIFHLLADRNFVAFFDQPLNICFAAVIRDAAHGSALFQAAVTTGQGQLQLFRRQFCIIEKHLVKIAQTEKEDLVGMLFLDGHVLFHHRGQFCHGAPPKVMR